MSKTAQSKENIFDALRKHADKIKQFGVKRIGIFGSFARGDASEESDVDVFVEFYPDKKTLRISWRLPFFSKICLVGRWN